MIEFLNEILLKNHSRIEQWMRKHRARVPIPIYTSVDLRNAGYKIGPIDTNIYPAGFNNLCTTYSQECVISFKKYISSNYGGASRILVIAESNTRNPYYVENLRCLLSMLAKDGYEARAGLLTDAPARETIYLKGLDGTLAAHRISRSGDSIHIAGFVPDVVISNNDFTNGAPEILRNAAQPINPSPALGWHMRRKSDHFVILEHLVEEFGELIDVDPWLMFPLTIAVRGVEFHSKLGLEKIAVAIDSMIERIGAKYAANGISDAPFVFIKSNSGTYGMGVMTAADGGEFLRINSDERKKMRRGKGGLEITEVIVQEGIPTKDMHDDCPVEPVIYLVGGEPVGGFYRINCKRTIRDNLNSRGMTFSKICFHQLDKEKHHFLQDAVCSEDVMMRVFGAIASICAIATGYENKLLAGD